MSDDRNISLSYPTASAVSEPKKTKKISWKSKLGDYFKAKGVKAAIDYNTIQDGDWYKSTVFCPELGYINGEKCSTSVKAEQDAAKKALKQLQLQRQ